MGRETVAVCYWEGHVAEAKLHLDSISLRLRGAMRIDIPRGQITGVTLVDEGVCVAIDGPELMIEMGLPEAARWQKALLKKPPTLAEKLGVSSQDPAYVSGAYEDAPLQDALADATVNEPQQASILIAVLTEVPDLEAASNLALAHPDKHVWMINPKGKAATVGDTMIRTHMRGRGFIDSKTSAVSDQLTATRYRLRAK